MGLIFGPFIPADSISDEEINFLCVFLHIGSGTTQDQSWPVVSLQCTVFGKQYVGLSVGAFCISWYIYVVRHAPHGRFKPCIDNTFVVAYYIYGCVDPISTFVRCNSYICSKMFISLVGVNYSYYICGSNVPFSL